MILLKVDCIIQSQAWKLNPEGYTNANIWTEKSNNAFLKDGNIYIQFSSVQSLSHLQLFATPWIATHQASLSITNSWSLLKLMSIESVMPSSHLILCHPLLLSPSIFPSIRDFLMSQFSPSGGQNFSFSISPSNEHPGLISFRMDWLDLLVVQGTLKSLLQHIYVFSNTYMYSPTHICSNIYVFSTLYCEQG